MSFNYSNGSLTGVPGYASSITYHPNGMVHKVRHSNGNIDTIAQDPRRMRRPYNITVSGPVQGTPSLGVHRYDGSGNLVSKSLDGLFLYDPVGRLKYFEAGSGGDQTYSYDAFGNMIGLTEHRPTGTEVRSFPVSTATNRLTNALYDDAGNMTSTAGQTYEYDGFNMLRHRNFPEHSYLYTADDERLLKYTFSGTPGGSFTEEWIWTIRDLDGKVLTKYDWNGGNGNVWEWKQDTIYRDGLMLAKETDLPGPQGEQHFHLDHLGTPRLTTQSDGSIYAANHYFGFGDALNETSDPERQKFTGHERDRNGGASHAKLDYMHARYYSPYMARFMSVDPINSALIRSPKSWNKYVYTENNPLGLVDPDGRMVRKPTPPTFSNFAKNKAFRDAFKRDITERVPLIGDELAEAFDALLFSTALPESMEEHLENQSPANMSASDLAPMGGVSSVVRGTFARIGGRMARAANLKRLGLKGVGLSGRSFNTGKKALENAGFTFNGTTRTGRKVFKNSDTGAEVYYDSGNALAPGQKPHWHIRDSSGNRYSRNGRIVESEATASHIPAR